MCDVLMEKGIIPDNKFTEYVLPIILGGLMSLLFVIVFHMDHDIWPKSKYQFLNLIFEPNNAPNDWLYLGILRRKLQY